MRTLKSCYPVAIAWKKLPQAGSDTGENISVSLFYEYAPTEVKLQEAAQKLFSDKSCGNVFRVKGYERMKKRAVDRTQCDPKESGDLTNQNGAGGHHRDRGTAGGGCNPQLSGSIGS